MSHTEVNNNKFHLSAPNFKPRPCRESYACTPSSTVHTAALKNAKTSAHIRAFYAHDLTVAHNERFLFITLAGRVSRPKGSQLKQL